jgi:predicted Zn-dependent protease
MNIRKKSPTRRFKSIILALVMMVALPLPAGSITIREEKKLSQEFMAAVSGQVTYINDLMIVSYVNRVGRKVLSQLPPQPFQYRFFVIKESTYNAFAGPGGMIFMHSGLIEAMESEDELAGILGHEITHVTSRHISDRIERGKKTGMISLAGLAAAIALGVAGAGDAATAAMMGAQATQATIELAYSREAEMQADQLGVEVLSGAGYSVEGLLTMLTKMRSKRWFGPEEIPSYLLTHPAVEERISYLSNWLATHEDETKKLPKADPYEFQKMRTRVEALYGDEDIAAMRLKAAATSRPGDPAAQYGYGLVLARQNNYSEALEYLRRALQKKAFDTDLLADMGGIYFFNGEYDRALDVLDGALSMAPEHPMGLFYYGRTQLALNHPEEAIRTLKMLIEKHPNYSKGELFLSQAYGKAGRMADAHYHLGLASVRKGDLRKAASQLEKALSMEKDPAKKKIIQEKLAEIKELEEKARNKKQKEG